ncbi:MAG TPA: hypothetical protein VFG28_15315 [Syntrophales bacterium]|nr:hypothetical protein [Syntrophales bacterium]
MITGSLKKAVFLMLIAFGVIAFQPAAQAGYIQLQLYNGTTNVIIDDGDTGALAGHGVDLNPLTGVVTFTGTLDTWTANVSTGLTYDIIGSASNPRLNLSSVNVTSSAGGFLLVGVSAINYTGPNSWQFQIGGTTEGAVSADALFDGGNDPAFFQYTTVLGSLAGTGGAFSDQISGVLSDLDFISPYGLSINSLIIHEAQGVSSFNANLTAVPIPGAFWMLGTGLIGLLGIRRRFRADK